MAKEDRGVVVIERDGGSSLWWFLVGGALGAGLALLFAPQSGDQTRRAVGRRLGKFRDVADDAFSDLRDVLSPDQRLHRTLLESEEDPEAETPAGSKPKEDAATPRRGGRASSARKELEQRLSEARARRQRALADEDEEPVA